MALAAPAVMPHVPPGRRGLAGGAIFTGVGLGIAASGTLVPLLMPWGLTTTWLGLGATAALLTALAWSNWPEAMASTASPSYTIVEAPSGPALRALYVEYALNAVGLVPHMVFLVDFVARGLGRGLHEAAQYLDRVRNRRARRTDDRRLRRRPDRLRPGVAPRFPGPGAMRRAAADDDRSAGAAALQFRRRRLCSRDCRGHDRPHPRIAAGQSPPASCRPGASARLPSRLARRWPATAFPTSLHTARTAIRACSCSPRAPSSSHWRSISHSARRRGIAGEMSVARWMRTEPS